MRVQGVTFNLRKITGTQMGKFFAAARANDVEGVAEGLTHVVETCPAEWGDPSKPETYLNQSYFDVLEPLVLDFSDERAGKN